MKLARELERRLERLVDGMSAALFRGRMQPVDLANRLVRQVDFLVADGPAGPNAPNVFEVGVNPNDVAEEALSDAVALELAHAVNATARERGWRLDGPVTVMLRTDDTVRPGSIGCEAWVEPGDLNPWGQLIDAEHGRIYELRHNRELVGRGDDADVLLDEPEVSRRHATIYIDSGAAQVVDLGSSNGTFVNDEPVGAEPAVLHPGDVVAFGPASFTFRLA